jgi:hypothetical protein
MVTILRQELEIKLQIYMHCMPLELIMHCNLKAMIIDCCILKRLAKKVGTPASRGQDFIFVTNQCRSGSTLLCQVFNRLPDFQ